MIEQNEEARKAVNAAFEVVMQAGQECHRRYFEIVCTKSTDNSRCSEVLIADTAHQVSITPHIGGTGGCRSADHWWRRAPPATPSAGCCP
jgi:hypothetical protein